MDELRTVANIILAIVACWNIVATRRQADLARRAFEVALSLPLRVVSVSLKLNRQGKLRVRIAIKNEASVPYVLHALDVTARLFTREGGLVDKHISLAAFEDFWHLMLRPGETKVANSLDTHGAEPDTRLETSVVAIRYRVAAEYFPKYETHWLAVWKSGDDIFHQREDIKHQSIRGALHRHRDKLLEWLKNTVGSAW